MSAATAVRPSDPGLHFIDLFTHTSIGEAGEALPLGGSLLIANALEHHTELQCNSAELADQF